MSNTAHTQAVSAVAKTLENWVYDAETITEDKTLAELGLDSLDVMEFVMDLEDALDGIHVNDELFHRGTTVRKVNNIIAEHIVQNSQ